MKREERKPPMDAASKPVIERSTLLDRALGLAFDGARNPLTDTQIIIAQQQRIIELLERGC